MGQIYKITNLINNKVYIGQTKYTAELRLQGHLRDMTRPEKSEYPLYRAFRKYGLQNFRLDILEDCPNDSLDEREIHYIKFYNTYYNGYNQTLGGQGTRSLELDNNQIVSEYREYNSMSKVASLHNVTAHTIKMILIYNGVKITSGNSNEEIGLIQLDKCLRPLNYFESKQDAYKWMVDNYKSDLKRSTFYYYSKRAYENYGMALGYYWILSDDVYDEAIKKIITNKNLQGNSRNTYVPSADELRQVYKECSFNKEETGRHFGVTGTTIARWFKKYKIIEQGK